MASSVSLDGKSIGTEKAWSFPWWPCEDRADREVVVAIGKAAVGVCRAHI